MYLHRSYPLALGAVVALSLSLAGCGPSKKEQCQQMLQTIQQGEMQRSLGIQTRETYQQNVQVYQSLADTLAAIDLSHKVLKPHQTQLVEAYQSKVEALNRYIAASNEEGILTHRTGDRDAEATIKSVMAAQQRSNTKVQLAINLLYNTCAN